MCSEFVVPERLLLMKWIVIIEDNSAGNENLETFVWRMMQKMSDFSHCWHVSWLNGWWKGRCSSPFTRVLPGSAQMVPSDPRKVKLGWNGNRCVSEFLTAQQAAGFCASLGHSSLIKIKHQVNGEHIEVLVWVLTHVNRQSSGILRLETAWKGTPGPSGRVSQNPGPTNWALSKQQESKTLRSKTRKRSGVKQADR